MIWDLENKFVSILEYDKEWEEKKLRKAEYEAGKEDGKSEGIEIGRDKTMAEIICNMIKSGFTIKKNCRSNWKKCRTDPDYIKSTSTVNVKQEKIF